MTKHSQTVSCCCYHCYICTNTLKFRNVVAHWMRNTTLGTTNKGHCFLYSAPRQMWAFWTFTK